MIVETACFPQDAPGDHGVGEILVRVPRLWPFDDPALLITVRGIIDSSGRAPRRSSAVSHVRCPFLQC